MSPQKSNRGLLIEGTLRCLVELPPDRVTARAIAEESGANLGSIVYHFGTKDELVTQAIVEGLDRWLEEIFQMMQNIDADTSPGRFRAAASKFGSSRRRHEHLARGLFVAVSRAHHDDRIRQLLVEGVEKTRPQVAQLIRLGEDETGTDAGSLVLSMFYGLLLQAVLQPDLAMGGDRLDRAIDRLVTRLSGDEYGGDTLGGDMLGTHT